MKLKNLKIAIVLNFGITAFEIAGGIYSGSLSLLSDALHNFTDAVALIGSFLAAKLALKPSSKINTFGYKRAEILAALFNAVLLLLASFFMFKEAVVRIFEPVSVNSSLMISLASAAFIGNVFSVKLLRRHSHENMNIKSSVIHLFADALTSLAVVAGGIFIYLFRIYWVDSLLTLVIGVYVLKEGYGIVVRSVSILMQKAPQHIQLGDIQKDIEQITGIKNIHHVHIWSLTEKDIHFEAHIDLSDDIRTSESCVLKDKIEKLLKEKYSINHCTLQFEYELCKNTGLIK